MGSKKIKWLIYTVLVGLIPIFSRLIVWIVTKEGSVDLLSPSDFVAFGLVLHISNINEIEHFSGVEREWKTLQNGISITFIAFYSVLFAITLIDEAIVDTQAITICTIVLSVVSFLISYSVYDRISKVPSPTSGDVI
ncbi:hypothetical protein Sbal625DRAFT_0029 [Shewanella baltica OS625]|uniref:hypothetical protein n=1 Tax=Shewanella baltica TaxID=62322 RepID=UPI000230D5AC|nr:hypothetical protein [Shewanella baltica]EHC07698.1 hypothetical protein Sbal625DRAFT_0029 [Shewanella baltica OS625]